MPEIQVYSVREEVSDDEVWPEAEKIPAYSPEHAAMLFGEDQDRRTVEAEIAKGKALRVEVTAYDGTVSLWDVYAETNPTYYAEQVK